MNNEDVITISFKNNYLITDRLFKIALENLYEKPEYENVITYNSIHDDSFVYQISCDKTGENMVTITRHGENEIETKIQGKKKHLQRFIHDLLAEISKIILLSGLKALHEESVPVTLEDDLDHGLHDLLQKIHETYFSS